MLSQKHYPQSYVDTCRRRFDDHVAAYATANPSEDLDAIYFNNLLIALEAHFVHRMRGAEGKDGNPLNEVRVFVDSLIHHDAVLTEAQNVKLKPETSLLGLEYGTSIALTPDQFKTLASAFLDEIETRFPDEG